MQPIPTKRALLAAALATLLAVPVAAEGVVSGARVPPCPTINLRDYWILAEIVNPTTGARTALRADCSDQSPVRCAARRGKIGYAGYLRDTVQKSRVDKETAGRPGEPWPEFIEAHINALFPPGIVGYTAGGAGGWATADEDRLRTLFPKPAHFSELRSEKGFSTRISTVRDGEWVQVSDVRLTMWLVTPAELAARDAAKAGLPAGKAMPASGRAPRR